MDRWHDGTWPARLYASVNQVKSSVNVGSLGPLSTAPRPSVRVRRSLLRYGERHCLGLPGEDVVVSINQLDLHLVLAGRDPGYVDYVVVTRIRPQPGQVVDGYVQVPDTWRCLEGTLPEHG